MTELKRIIMERDGLTSEEADELIETAHEEVMNGDSPEDVLEIYFGLEPDYIFDLVG